MSYSFAAPATAVDTNSDGFVDKVYIGDLGGQMWVFDVPFDEAEKRRIICKWTGKILFKAPSSQAERHPIYYQPAVASDRYGNPWSISEQGIRKTQ
jgi:type IV pilus assembly protein PilY1